MPDDGEIGPSEVTIYAHSLPGEPERQWERLADHLTEVGEKASSFAAWFGAEQAARAAGLLHDIGKVSAAFQRRLRDGPKVNHSTAGAIEANKRYGGALGKLLAFAIAGHHAGLADGAGAGGSTLQERLRADIPDYAGWEAHALGLPDTLTLSRPIQADKDGYCLAFLGRMLFSCLVDADFLATENFYLRNKGENPQRNNLSPDELERRLRLLQARLDTHLLKFGEPTGALNRLRADILGHARMKAVACTPGLFTMTVPTGGGKTLASLAFALDHAIAHGLRRVIYVIPYTSIIEQTAEVFREALGDADVLEHHGNVDWDAAPRRNLAEADDEGPDGSRKLRRAAENWDVPVVVTTAVQFFESLHAARTSRCRKLHNIAGSVVVLDEAQTMPVHLLRPCLRALDELARNYRVSVVQCTATQPAVRKQDGFKGGLDIPDDRELAPDPKGLYEKLDRVTVEVRPGQTADAEIAARFADAPQLLCIVNTRAHAQQLSGLIERMDGARHLTTLMCPAHRRQVLAEVREDLRAGKPVRLVSTSLIEAGVDLDFPEVWRAEAGLESVAQAAGRCNREGKLTCDGAPAKGRVVMFSPSDAKELTQIRQNVSAMKAALRKHGDAPLGVDAVKTYFDEFFWSKGPENLDAARLGKETFPILKAIADRKGSFDFPYASIAEAFRMIDDVMDPVIVPWAPFRGEVLALVAELRTAAGSKFHPPGRVLRRLQQFTVLVPSRVRRDMLASGAVQLVHADYGDQFVFLEAQTLYREQTGLFLNSYDL
ncbi:MAG: CRISPR-associated endonuclease Cas3'', partial [Novosphingobium sp.]